MTFNLVSQLMSFANTLRLFYFIHYFPRKIKQEVTKCRTLFEWMTGAHSSIASNRWFQRPAWCQSLRYMPESQSVGLDLTTNLRVYTREGQWVLSSFLVNFVEFAMLVCALVLSQNFCLYFGSSCVKIYF